MAKRKKRMRRAYLKVKKSFYDPYSPYALRTRGAKVINFRKEIPTEHISLIRERQLRVVWCGTLRGTRYHEWNRQVVDQYPNYSLELYFTGQEVHFVEEDFRMHVRKTSRNYSSTERAWKAYHSKSIRYDHQEELSEKPGFPS